MNRQGRVNKGGRAAIQPPAAFSCPGNQPWPIALQMIPSQVHSTATLCPSTLSSSDPPPSAVLDPWISSSRSGTDTLRVPVSRHSPATHPDWLTRWNYNPDEVHREVVYPEIIRLWPAVRNTMGVVVNQAGRIVQHVAVQMAHAGDDLQRMAQRVLSEYRICHR